MTLTLTAVEVPPDATRGAGSGLAGDHGGDAPLATGPASASAPASTPWWDDLPSAFQGALSQPWRLLVLLALAPLAAGLIVVALGGRADPQVASTAGDWSEVSRSIASGLFWLGFSAIALGLTDAILGVAFEGTTPAGVRKSRGIARFVARSAVLAPLCLAQCGLALAIVHRGLGLRGPGLPMLGLLALASAVGLMMGLAVVSPARRPALAPAVLPPALFLLWLLGGYWRPLAATGPPIRMAASVLPTRWAFEALLLLESRADPRDGSSQPVPPPLDLAAEYFPAETEQMGVRTGTIALGAMLIGLAAGAAFLSEE